MLFVPKFLGPYSVLNEKHFNTTLRFVLHRHLFRGVDNLHKYKYPSLDWKLAMALSFPISIDFKRVKSYTYISVNLLYRNFHPKIK